ncbi:Multidrug resistance protein MdtC [Oligella sp. MSHR50489EDL]|uniref:efflux RND transporter permease subunit n=1 Tax=Oligella sp. MSHR50489EDL TaxID=3139409 RepID=UPI003D81635D
MNLSALFIKRPVATFLLAITMAICGVVSYLALPVAPLPNLSVPEIFVRASLPGASPETMASSVATPLQRALGTISGVDVLSSTSQEGSTQIIILFEMNKDVNDAAREVQAAINKAQSLLPSNMRTPPTYRKMNPSSSPIMVLTLTSESHNLGELYDMATTVIAQKVAQVEGVGEVSIGGSSMPAVRVDLNPMQLNSYGITLDEVSQAISESNQNKPRGFIENKNLRWIISTNGILYKAVDYQDLIIRWQDGQAVRLKDVAHVYDSVENEYNFGFLNNQQAINLIIRREESANIIQTVDGIKEQLPALNALLPAQVDLNVSQDRSPSIRATVFEAEKTLIIAVVLVALVVLAFLRKLRITIIPAVSVPISLFGSFVIMYFMGFSLNTISLMALIVATGFVVDDSIVVVENIVRHMEKGLPPLEAALKGSKEVSFTVVTMSLSLVIVFMPLLLIHEMIGKLFYEFAMTLTVAVLVSLVVSLTLVPMLCALWLRPDKDLNDSAAASEKPNLFVRIFERSYDLAFKFYKVTLAWSLRWRFVTFFSLLLVIILNVHLFITVPKGFFPQQDTGMILGMFRVDEGTSFETMKPKLDEYRRIILADPNVATVSGFAGGLGGSSSSFMTIQLVPFEERELSAQEVINQLRNKLSHIPGASMFLFARQDIPGSGGLGGQDSGEYQFLLKAGDLPTLREWTAKVRAAFFELPELVDVSEGSEDKGRRLELQIDREKAQRLGVDMSLVAGTLNNLYASRQVSVIYEELNQYNVVMGANARYARDATVLDDLMVMTRDGRAIPISSFTTLSVANAPLRVNQQEGMLADSISFGLAEGVTLGQAREAINEALVRINLPTRLVQAGFYGTAADFEKMQRQQPIMFLAVIVLLYLLLGILYESYIHPITILSTLPSAGFGALLALNMVNMEFTIIALIGLFLLIGIVKKNAIIMIDFALQRQRADNLSSEQAIYEACLVRFRPILMTTFSALFGALPLILATGAGVEMRQPLGITIVGGLLMSQILTLYSTPVVYLYLDHLVKWFRHKVFVKKKFVESKQ